MWRWLNIAETCSRAFMLVSKCCGAGHSSRAVSGVGLRPLACWDCGFESRRGMNVFVECCLLSGSGLCDGLITRPEESYRLWCVVLCDLETSWMRRPLPALGRSATGRKRCNYWCLYACVDRTGWTVLNYKPGRLFRLYFVKKEVIFGRMKNVAFISRTSRK